MAAKKKTTSKPPKRHRGTTPEARENQLISAAMNLAEEQIMNGTASPSIIVHFLKLGSTREQLEKERIEENINLYKAKTESLHSSKEMEVLYSRAIEAMRVYGGGSKEDELT